MTTSTGERARAGMTAVVMTMAAVCLVLQGCGPGNGGTGNGNAATTPTFAGFGGPKGQWVSVGALAGGLPAIAAEDPRVVYQVQGDEPRDDGKHIILRRSEDGGATWQTLPVPPLQAQSHTGTTMPGWYRMTPSPLDPRTVFLTAAVPYPVRCPTWQPGARAYTGGRLASGFDQCSFVFRSTDSGEHWTQLHLPVGGMLSFAQEVRPVSNDPVFYAQGTRLYSYDFSDTYSNMHDDRLVRSDDGGATWQPIDGPLLEQGQGVLDYVPTRTGATVFALATPDGMDPPATLWRSDDAGATWRKVAPMPFNGVSNMVVVLRPGGGEPLLYLATAVKAPTAFGGTDAAFVVSEDGGATWRQAPNGGKPANDVEPSIVGVLGDGSILARSPAPSPSGPTVFMLHAWKDGDGAWRQVTTPLEGDAVLMVTPTGPGHDAIWAVVSFYNGGVERWVTG